MSEGTRGSGGPGVRPPHPATVAGSVSGQGSPQKTGQGPQSGRGGQGPSGRPPHPATVAPRAPHPATVVQGKVLLPHPATVVQATAPHRAKVVQGKAQWPHPATVQGKLLPPHPATVVQAKAPHPVVGVSNVGGQPGSSLLRRRSTWVRSAGSEGGQPGSGLPLCDGQLLPIHENQALFAILGTTYGGDGKSTFALPDLRGRFAMHPGQGPGLTARQLGERGGAEVAGQLPKGGPRGFNVGTCLPAIVPPFTAINHIIAIDGVVPVRV